MAVLVTKTEATAERVKRLWRARQRMIALRKVQRTGTLKQYEVVEDLVDKAFAHPAIQKEVKQLEKLGLLQP